MDIKCLNCREPWHIDTIHEFNDMNREEKKEFMPDFKINGFRILHCDACKHNGKRNTEDLKCLHDLLGNDVDGIAVSIEDFNL